MKDLMIIVPSAKMSDEEHRMCLPCSSFLLYYKIESKFRRLFMTPYYALLGKQCEQAHSLSVRYFTTTLQLELMEIGTSELYAEARQVESASSTKKKLLCQAQNSVKKQIKNEIFWTGYGYGWGCSSLGRILAYCAQSPRFDPQNHIYQLW